MTMMTQRQEFAVVAKSFSINEETETLVIQIVFSVSTSLAIVFVAIANI